MTGVPGQDFTKRVNWQVNPKKAVKGLKLANQPTKIGLHGLLSEQPPAQLLWTLAVTSLLDSVAFKDFNLESISAIHLPPCLLIPSRWEDSAAPSLPLPRLCTDMEKIQANTVSMGQCHRVQHMHTDNDSLNLTHLDMLPILLATQTWPKCII